MRERGIMLEKIYIFMLNYPLRVYEPLALMLWYCLSQLWIKTLKSKKEDFITRKIFSTHSYSQGLQYSEEAGYFEYRHRLVYAYLVHVFCLLMMIIYLFIILIKCYSFIKK